MLSCSSGCSRRWTGAQCRGRCCQRGQMRQRLSAPAITQSGRDNLAHMTVPRHRVWHEVIWCQTALRCAYLPEHDHAGSFRGSTHAGLTEVQHTSMNRHCRSDASRGPRVQQEDAGCVHGVGHLGGEVEQVPGAVLLESEHGLAVVDGVHDVGALADDAADGVVLQHAHTASVRHHYSLCRSICQSQH